MANFEAKKLNLKDINNGQKWELGQSPSIDTFNAPVEAAAYAQEVVEDVRGIGTNQPNTQNANVVGTPSVYIETIANGSKRLAFYNLKGEKGEKGEDGITPDMSNYYTKEEVDKKNRDIQKEVDNLYVITGATVTDKYPLSQAYSTRETADGNADIIDGALTRVTKIQGATVASKNLITLPYSFTTSTVNGITFTAQSDGGIKVTGTATAVAVRNLNKTPLKGLNLNSKNGSIETGGGFTISGGKDGVTVAINAGDGWAYMYVEKGKTVDTVIYPMFQYGADTSAAANTYRPYFSGLKNAYFKGIRSTGKNLFNPNRTVKDFGAKYDNKAKRDFDENAIYIGATANNYYDPSRVSNASYENGKFTFTVAPELYGIAIPFKVAPNTTYTFSKQILNGTNTRTSIGYYTSNGTFISFEYTKNTFTTPSNCGWVTVVVNNTTGLSVAQTISYNNVQLEYGDTTTEHEPYKADESFMLDEAVGLPKWDYIDTERGKVVRQTRIFTLDGTQSWIAINMPSSIGALYAYKINFTYSALGGVKYDAMVNQKRADIKQLNLSGGNPSIGFSIIELHTDTLTTVEEVQSYFTNNPLEVAYGLLKTTEVDLAIPTDKYKSWVHGSETQIQGDKDNSADGANCEITQIYYTQKGA